MKQRMIRDTLWTDPWIEDLDPSEKLVYLHLLTNPSCNVAGIYQIKTNRIAFETWLHKETVDKILDRFSGDNKIIRIESRIFLKNFAKNQSTNPSITQWMERIINSLPEAIVEVVKTEWDSLSHFTLLNLTLPNFTKPNLTIPNSNENIVAEDILPTALETNDIWADEIKKDNSLADDIYENYVNRFTKWVKKHKRKVAVDRIKLELKRWTTKETIIACVDSYFLEKKDTISSWEWMYIKTAENFFWYVPWTKVKFIDSYKEDNIVDSTLVSKSIEDLTEDELMMSVTLSWGIVKWKNQYRWKLLELKVDSPEEFNKIIELAKKIQEEENKSLYLN